MSTPKEIYALFLYYGDGVMVSKNFLCIKYGTPRDILDWLLQQGYLEEVYSLGQFMGFDSDEPYLEDIERLMSLSSVTVKDISDIDIQMPSCCTCKAVSKSFGDMSEFRDIFMSLLSQSNIGTVKKGEELDSFLSSLEEACVSNECCLSSTSRNRRNFRTGSKR